MADNQTLPLVDGPITFEGAVSLEATEQGVIPWRLPVAQLELFEPELRSRASQPSGIRLTMLSDTPLVALEVEPVDAPGSQQVWDLLVDGQLQQRRSQSLPESSIVFDDLPARRGVLRRIEVYLPSHYNALRLRRVSIAADATAQRWVDPRKRWVVYGSSITQAKDAAGPSETYPAIVANRFNLHLTNLGYGGQEHLEPMVARMIRDLPADYLSLCVSGNVWGSASLSPRTYRAAVIGLVQTIRDKHPRTPMALTSFIAYHNEGANNLFCVPMEQYRQWTAQAIETLQRQGDANLHYIDGPAIFGRDLGRYQPDGVHPDAQGQRILGQRYGDLVMPKLGLM